MESVNWLVVAGAAVAAWIIGALWYSALFAKAWVAAHGYSEDQLKAMSANAPKAYIGSLVAMFLSAFVMSIFFHHMGVADMKHGVNWAFHAWLGFAMPVMLITHLYSDKKLATFLIDTGYHLVLLCTMGAIIGKWGA